MFGSTYLEPGKILHNFERPLIVGSFFDKPGKMLDEVIQLMGKVFEVVSCGDIKGMKYLKIFVNANNAIPAILGKSMQESFADIGVARISIAIWKEALDIVTKLGIKLESLPDFPLERVMKLTAMPAKDAAGIFSGIMVNLSKEPLYGSILQSIKRGKPSEIDYINGEFTRLAKANNLSAPLSEKLVNMVHSVEKTGKFFTKDELISETRGLFN
jgi:2-dehydropantoate 2-reductase